MTDSLADLDTLVLKCRAERSRDYVSESIRCYKAGAYRSTIVNVWIAIVFDLVDKIRDLALAGDAKAQRINSRYETCGFHGHPATYSMNIRPLIPR